MGKFFEKPQNGKPKETRDNLWNQDKTERGQTELKRRKKKAVEKKITEDLGVPIIIRGKFKKNKNENKVKLKR